MSAASEHPRKLRKLPAVLICGGGNAVHVLVCLIATHFKGRREVRVLTTFGDEAEKWNKSLKGSDGITCDSDVVGTVVGRPDKVSKDPAEVVPGAGLIMFAVPAFAHEAYLKAVKPHLTEDTVIGAMPGQGCFDLLLRHTLGAETVDAKISAIFALETLPWACRIVEYARKVEVLGTKQDVDMFVSPTKKADEVRQLLQECVGAAPRFNLVGSPLDITLMNINAIWHPTITYGQYRNWDRVTPFKEAPLFYEGVDDFTGSKLSAMSDEMQKVKEVLLDRYPGKFVNDLCGVRHVREWMTLSYGNDIPDQSSLRAMLNTNKGYQALRHPMVPVERSDRDEKEEEPELLPNFRARYVAEDTPCGLVAMRGIAQLAGVPTPNIDEVLTWCQARMGKNYLAAPDPDDKDSLAKLSNESDLKGTRAPQIFGVHSLDELVRLSTA